jgi:hypothetical protein
MDTGAMSDRDLVQEVCDFIRLKDVEADRADRPVQAGDLVALVKQELRLVALLEEIERRI